MHSRLKNHSCIEYVPRYVSLHLSKGNLCCPVIPNWTHKAVHGAVVLPNWFTDPLELFCLATKQSIGSNPIIDEYPTKRWFPRTFRRAFYCLCKPGPGKRASLPKCWPSPDIVACISGWPKSVTFLSDPTMVPNLAITPHRRSVCSHCISPPDFLILTCTATYPCPWDVQLACFLFLGGWDFLDVLNKPNLLKLEARPCVQSFPFTAQIP